MASQDRPHAEGGVYPTRRKREERHRGSATDTAKSSARKRGVFGAQRNQLHTKEGARARHVNRARTVRRIYQFAARKGFATVACAGLLALLLPTAASAKAFSLNENGDLRLTSKQGFTLNEDGPVSGTVGGTLYVHLKIVSSSRVTAEISFYPHGGSITCDGSARYKRSGSTASFAGALSIERGTGSYAHARGSGLSFSGTIQRSNDAIAVHVGGTASD